MREIKFRAWDARSVKGRMVKVHSLQFNDWVNVNGDVPLTLMQYTGLKDNNGFEIYEGDIVEEDSLGRPQIVFYSTEHAGFKLGFNGDNTQYDKRESLWADYCKVIGNIYENPELVK